MVDDKQRLEKFSVTALGIQQMGQGRISGEPAFSPLLNACPGFDGWYHETPGQAGNGDHGQNCHCAKMSGDIISQGDGRCRGVTPVRQIFLNS